MKSTLLIAALLLFLAALGCQPVVDKTNAATVERPPAASPRPVTQEAREYPIPSFVVTDLSETRSVDAWTIAGVIQQREPVMAGLKFDRILITFAYLDGRTCEYIVADHGPLKGLVEPTPFVLDLSAGNYRHAGFGFESFQDFEATSRLDKVFVQILTNRFKLQSGPNKWTGQFEAN